MYEGVLAKVCRTLEASTSADPHTIRGEMALADLEGWDSLGVVHFLGEVALIWPSVTLPAAELEGAVTVADIARVITRRLG